MPPTPWQTEIVAPEICAGAVPRIWRTLSCNAYMPYIAGMHVGKPAAIGVERQFAAGGGVALGDEGSGLTAPHKAQILEAIDQQMGEGVVDHQMVDVAVRDPGLGKGRGAGDAECARGGEICHLADHLRLDTLAGADEVDRLLREIAGALGGDQEPARRRERSDELLDGLTDLAADRDAAVAHRHIGIDRTCVARTKV